MPSNMFHIAYENATVGPPYGSESAESYDKPDKALHVPVRCSVNSTERKDDSRQADEGGMLELGCTERNELVP
jgi:hypothetical protein